MSIQSFNIYVREARSNSAQRFITGITGREAGRLPRAISPLLISRLSPGLLCPAPRVAPVAPVAGQGWWVYRGVPGRVGIPGCVLGGIYPGCVLGSIYPGVYHAHHVYLRVYHARHVYLRVYMSPMGVPQGVHVSHGCTSQGVVYLRVFLRVWCTSGCSSGCTYPGCTPVTYPGVPLRHASLCLILWENGPPATRSGA